MSEMEQLQKCVAALESQNRKIRWVIGGLTLLVLLLAFVTARLWTRDNLALRELTVKDKLGNVVATLASQNSRTCLHLNGRQDTTSVDLCADNRYGSFLNLRNHDPESSASISAGQRVPEGGWMVPGLFIKGAGENTFEVNVSGGGVNVFGDKLEDKAEVVVGKGPDSSAVVLLSGQDKPAVQVLGPDGKIRWTTP
jgi:hypothetical protein